MKIFLHLHTIAASLFLSTGSVTWISKIVLEVVKDGCSWHNRKQDLPWLTQRVLCCWFFFFLMQYEIQIQKTQNQYGSPIIPPRHALISFYLPIQPSLTGAIICGLVTSCPLNDCSSSTSIFQTEEEERQKANVSQVCSLSKSSPESSTQWPDLPSIGQNVMGPLSPRKTEKGCGSFVCFLSRAHSLPEKKKLRMVLLERKGRNERNQHCISKYLWLQQPVLGLLAIWIFIHYSVLYIP